MCSLRRHVGNNVNKNKGAICPCCFDGIGVILLLFCSGSVSQVWTAFVTLTLVKTFACMFRSPLATVIGHGPKTAIDWSTVGGRVGGFEPRAITKTGAA